MPDDTCAVTDCAKPTRTYGLCYGHYMKAWRYGTPTPNHPRRWVDYTGVRFGSLVATSRTPEGRWLCTCDCGRTTIVLVGDLRRGTTTTCGDRKHRRRDDAGYAAAHGRCETDRGPAHAHLCIDCGQPAKHWSYDHDDPQERVQVGGYGDGCPYSLDPAHYSPRCVPCHKTYDLGTRAA